MNTLHIRLLNGQTATVRALPTGVPGLAAHATPPGARHPGWRLTHIRSGNSLVRFPPSTDPEAVLACAGDLAAVADWTRPARELDTQQMRIQVHAIAKRWGHDRRVRAAECLDDLPAVAP